MQALILAGGQATRLRPITHDTPKCLLKIGEKSILDFQLDALKANGVNRIIIVTGFKAELIKQHVLLKHPDLEVTFIYNESYETTRAAYGIWTAREKLTTDTIYLNADLLCDANIIAEIINSDKPSITAVQKNDWDEEEVNVIADDQMNVSEIGKLIPENDSYGEFIGATKLSASFMNKLVNALEEMIASGDTQRFAVDAINTVIQKHNEQLAILDVTHYQAIEIDTIEDFEHAQSMWK